MDIGTLALRLSADPSQMTSGLGGAITSIQKFGNNVTSVMDSVTAAFASNPIGFAITAAIKAFQIAEGVVAGLAGQLQSLNAAGMAAANSQAALERKFGLTASAAGGFSLMVQKLGLDQDSVNQALLVFQVKLGEAQAGSETANKAFERLHLNASDLARMPLPEALGKIGDSLNQFAPGSERAAAAFQLLGRRGADLLPLIQQGGQAFADAAKQSERWGLTFAEGDAASVKAATVAMREADVAVGSIRQSFGNAFAVLFAPLEKGFANLVTKIIEKAEPVLDWFRKGIKNLEPIALAIVGGMTRAWDKMQGPLSKTVDYILETLNYLFGGVGTIDDWATALGNVAEIVVTGVLWGAKMVLDYYTTLAAAVGTIYKWWLKVWDVVKLVSPAYWLAQALLSGGDEPKTTTKKKDKGWGFSGLEEMSLDMAGKDAKQTRDNYHAPEAIQAGSTRAIDAINASMRLGEADKDEKEKDAQMRMLALAQTEAVRNEEFRNAMMRGQARAVSIP